MCCSLLALAAADLHAQAAKKLPAAVQKEVAGMAKMCREVGGKPGKSQGVVTAADLTGDGVPDYVLDQAAYVCDGAASLFAGSGGSQVMVFVGAADGQAKPGFTAGTFGVKVEKDSKPARLHLLVGGELCGQKITPNMSRAEFKSCWRPVRWNEKAKKLEYAPVSQIKPVT